MTDAPSRPTVLRALAAALLVVAWSGVTRASDTPRMGTGVRVAALGDLNGDGKPELATVRDGVEREVVVYSTGGGSVLWRAEGIDATGVPDQDGDGLPDVVVAAHGSARTAWAVVCKGTDGKVLSELRPKEGALLAAPWIADARTEWVSALGAAGEEAKPGLLVVRTNSQKSAFGASPSRWCEAAKAFVVALDGTVLARVDTVVDPAVRAPVATPAGDADGDGKDDVFVCGEPERSSLRTELRTLAGDVLLRFKGSPKSPPPSAVARCGDLDGDGVPDVAMGVASAGKGRRSDVGEVWLLSGKSGKIVRTIRGSDEWERLGNAVAPLPDIDGDGVADVAIGAPGRVVGDDHRAFGAVIAVSGRTGKPIWTAEGDAECEALGYALAVLGDCDGDGVADLAAGAPGAGAPGDRGSARVLSGKTGTTIVTYRGH